MPLATLRFRALAAGTSTIAAASTAADTTEGFPLPAPAAPGFFDAVQATQRSLSVSAPTSGGGPSNGNGGGSAGGGSSGGAGDSGGGGGGATGLFSLLGLLVLAARRRFAA